MTKISNNPLVSVIIPNYNHAKYLDERIQSVLNQTYQNFEVIILDDVSTDNSKDVIEKYRGNQHVTHIVYNEKNSGLPFKQWDKGISLAKGEIIWLAESDDSCDKRLLEVLVDDLVSNNCIYVFCRLICMDGEGFLRDSIMGNIGNKTVNSWNGKDFISQHLVYGNAVINASGCIFRKDAALKVDHHYEKYRGSGDWLFWIEMAELGNVGFDQRSMNFFRQHGDNTTAVLVKNGTNMLDDHDIFEYLKRKGLITRRQAFINKYRRINQYLGTNFENPKTKQEVLERWGYNPLTYFVILPYRLFQAFKKILRVN